MCVYGFVLIIITKNSIKFVGLNNNNYYFLETLSIDNNDIIKIIHIKHQQQMMELNDLFSIL